MSLRSKTSISDRISAAQLAIKNALDDPEIAAAVAEFGYTTEKLNAGKGLLDEAQDKVAAQKLATGTYRKSTAEMQKADTAARDAYQALAKVARASFTKDQLTTLGLNRREPKRIALFLTAAYVLFDNAMNVPEMLEALNEYGYDQARLTQGKAMITALDDANRAQEAAKGDAQQTTQDQDKAVRELYKWYAQFIKIARVALRDKKQLLEKLGIPARTSKTAAQRAGTQKAAETRAAGKDTGTTSGA